MAVDDGGERARQIRKRIDSVELQVSMSEEKVAHAGIT
jgi:hypothetical protein